MAGVVHIPWYATGFRGDKLEAALAEVAPIAVRYGATSYDVWRSRDDRYKFLMAVGFETKSEWTAFWEGREMTRFRVTSSGWYQVPVLYVWHDSVVSGRGPGSHAGSAAPANGAGQPVQGRATPARDPKG